MDLNAYRFTINPVGLTGAAATDYVSKVSRQLTSIYCTTVGRMLLNSIRFHGLGVEIRPYPATDCNSSGGGEFNGGVLRGFAQYSPDTFGPHGACAGSPSNKGMAGDEILFHELVHAFRNVSRKWSAQPLTGGLVHYDNSEEFLAVMVTNIYISDRSKKVKTGLRQDHHSFNPLERDFSKPYGFFLSGMQTFSLVKKFVGDNQGFTAMVAHANTAFNPIAEYIANPAKAEEVSKKALPRDIVGVIVDLKEFAERLL